MLHPNTYIRVCIKSYIQQFPRGTAVHGQLFPSHSQSCCFPPQSTGLQPERNEKYLASSNVKGFWINNIFLFYTHHLSLREVRNNFSSTTCMILVVHLKFFGELFKVCVFIFIAFWEVIYLDVVLVNLFEYLPKRCNLTATTPQKWRTAIIKPQVSNLSGIRPW